MSIDNVWAILRSTAFNPYVTGFLLLGRAAFLRVEAGKSGPAPDLAQLKALVLSDPASRRTLVLFVLGALGKLNAAANWWARNNGTWDKYDWSAGSKELVVITGGAGGIGGEAARLFAAKGIRVAVIDVQDLTYPRPTTVTFYKCDLTNSEEISSVAARIREELGHPTVLINNAGIVRIVSVLDSTKRDIDATYDINVKAHYYTVQAFLPEMLKRNHGHVVTLASVAAYVQAPYSVAYCSSKAAALSFHEGLTAEILHIHNAPKVRTSVVCPAHMKTTMFVGFENSAPSFLTPSLVPSKVAQDIVDGVLKGDSFHLLTPLFTNALPIARGLPYWHFKHLVESAKNSMKNVKAKELVTKELVTKQQ